MNAHDTNAELLGHFHLAVIEGDVERAPLTPEQVRENEAFALLNPWAPYPLHAGRIVSHPIDEYEFDNLIVTVGKQMILDRLFGIGGPPGAMTRIGVGTSNTAAAVGDTALTGGVFKVFDSAATRSALVVTSIATFLTTDANIVWAELAMDNSTTLLDRIAPIGPFTKTSAVSIVVTTTITQA